MSTTSKSGTNGQVAFDCRCGHQVIVDVDDLGNVLQCPSCERYLRPGLSMILKPTGDARNMSVVCTCGHFVIAQSKRPGRIVQCDSCKQRLKLPPAQKRAQSEVPVRIPAKSLRRMIAAAAPKSQARPAQEQSQQEIRLTGMGRSRCVNTNCGAEIMQGANVCYLCGCNQVTRKLYPGKDPGREKIRGYWPGPLNW